VTLRGVNFAPNVTVEQRIGDGSFASISFAFVDSETIEITADGAAPQRVIHYRVLSPGQINHDDFPQGRVIVSD
jgi:hypothetical protein